MSNSVPSDLSLSAINTGDAVASAPLRNNYAAIQIAVNQLIACLSGGTNGQVLSALDGTDVQWVDGSLSYRKTTSKPISNSTAETDLLNGEITVAANAMEIDKTLRLTAWGNISNSDALVAMPRFKLKLGSTVLLDSGAGPTEWSTGGESSFRVVGEITNLGAANSQTAALNGVLSGSFGDGSGNFVTGAGVYSTNTTNMAFLSGWNNGLAVDTTTSQVLALTCILPVASASVEITLQNALVEIV